MTFSKKITSAALKLSIAASLVIGTSAMAASSSGFIEGSSESTSALLEDPGFEAQINRINTGINLVRINNTILKHMPVSEDSAWIDDLVSNIDYDVVHSMKEVKEDAYYSTVTLTNAILGRKALGMSPLDTRLYWEARAIYKNRALVDVNATEAEENKMIEVNGEKTVLLYDKKYHLPSMHIFPNIFKPATFLEYPITENVQFIDVTAEKGELYPSAGHAALSLVPEALHEDIIEAKAAFDEAEQAALDVAIEKADIFLWLEDPANADSSERILQQGEFDAKELELETAKAVIDEKEDIFLLLVEGAAEAISNDFDETKVPLAKKLQKLFDAIDNNAIGAASMFAAATVGIYKGRGVIEKELQALQTAQAYTNLVGNQKSFLISRIKNMGMGSLYAIPNIALGTYYATKQALFIGKYQNVVEAVLDAHEIAEEAKAAAAEATEAPAE